MTFEYTSKNKYILFVIALLILCIGAGYMIFFSDNRGYEDATHEDGVAWERIENAIAQCEVESVFQAHSKDVSVVLKDGTRLSGTEPYIDAIIDRAVAASERCGDIMMATE